MTALEQINQMRNQGMADEQIISSLQQQGISPNEINQALSQAQIKSAVADDYVPQQDTYTPQQTQGYSTQPQQAPPEEIYQQDYSPQQEGYADYGVATGNSTDTMIEIAGQVFSEKIQKIQKKVDEMNEFKTISQTKIENIDERLKKIEKIIDTMQIKILEKVGNYGRELDKTKKELAMVEDSFGKIVNKTAHTSAKKHTKKKSSKK